MKIKVDVKSVFANHVSQIKALRMVTGLGLKETKDITDRLRNHEGPVEVTFLPANQIANYHIAMADFREYFHSWELPKTESTFNYRAEVRKLAIMAIEADDLSAAKELISLFA